MSYEMFLMLTLDVVLPALTNQQNHCIYAIQYELLEKGNQRIFHSLSCLKQAGCKKTQETIFPTVWIWKFSSFLKSLSHFFVKAKYQELSIRLSHIHIGTLDLS